VDRPSRLVAALRWLAPSLVAVCLAAVIAGVIEGLAAGFGPVGASASAGFAAILAVPVCLAGALIVRGLWAAWRPARLAAGLVEEGGGAPRLAGWIGFLLFGAAFLSWATFNGVRGLSQLTTFKVTVVSLAMPFVVIAAAGLLAVVSRPLVDVLAACFRALDRRARARLGRSLVTPRIVLGATIGLGVAGVLFGWFVSIRPRLGALDVGILLHPAIAVAVTAAAHPLWRRLRAGRARRAAAAAVAAATLAIAAAAVWVKVEQPSRLLSIWAQPTIGGLAIEVVVDVDTLRSRAMLEAKRPRLRDGATPRDIILVTIDTVRHDRTPLGGGRAAMPTLAKLGKDGVVFDRAFAPSNTTRRSMPAIMLGASPSRIRGRVSGWALRLDPRHVPLAERLYAAGYQTAGFFCCASFWGPERKTGYARGLEEVLNDKDGEVLAAAARDWLRARADRGADRPAFVWLHFLEPHQWLRRKDGGVATSAKDSKYRRYDKALAEVDEFLAELVAAIEAIPAERRPILAITSDHGEGLGEHGATHHSSNLYDSQIRVPLVLVGPGLPAARIAEPVSLTDLAPTLLDLAGFEPPGMPDMDGRSLADLVTGARAPDPEGGYAFAAMIQDRSTPHSARAVVRGRWKLIDGPKGLELYDLRTDPKELKELGDEEPGVRDELKALLDAREAIDATAAF
jgi:arylsulfatase A-like enzyme